MLEVILVRHETLNVGTKCGYFFKLRGQQGSVDAAFLSICRENTGAVAGLPIKSHTFVQKKNLDFTPVSELPLSAGRKVAVCRDATAKVYEDQFFWGGCWSYFSFGSN